MYKSLILLTCCSLHQAVLTSSSHNIFNFTNGRVAWKTVNIVLPTSWQAASCPTPSDDVIVASDRQDEDIKIIPSHPVLGNLPWTLQFGGCGQRGKNMELPLQFINKNKTIAAKSYLLTKEWIKLRFGVFEETGFHADKIYPDSFVEAGDNKSNNGCHGEHQVCSINTSHQDLIKYFYSRYLDFVMMRVSTMKMFQPNKIFSAHKNQSSLR